MVLNFPIFFFCSIKKQAADKGLAINKEEEGRLRRLKRLQNLAARDQRLQDTAEKKRLSLDKAAAALAAKYKLPLDDAEMLGQIFVEASQETELWLAKKLAKLPVPHPVGQLVKVGGQCVRVPPEAMKRLMDTFQQKAPGLTNFFGGLL
jgi:hypothetical protein